MLSNRHTTARLNLVVTINNRCVAIRTLCSVDNYKSNLTLFHQFFVARHSSTHHL